MPSGVSTEIRRTTVVWLIQAALNAHTSVGGSRPIVASPAPWALLIAFTR